MRVESTETFSRDFGRSLYIVVTAGGHKSSDRNEECALSSNAQHSPGQYLYTKYCTSWIHIYAMSSEVRQSICSSVLPTETGKLLPSSSIEPSSNGQCSKQWSINPNDDELASWLVGLIDAREGISGRYRRESCTVRGNITIHTAWKSDTYMY
ncbi:uncharacterized protein BO66DRAFT_53161 [Aspergillus aculeatinus CBS 121060]|uniref:Uncharacterized protein n=1 Tax=Aspergillus aculeatinus CBS 121060 TaxID=1448322 RepID=A0ACD1HDU4_9EURO|nr:hypothetical protein BO66DRAFT_53161 [Aspergillus aculeatinus CBS 121060]RAH71609.1 hypothetical protein BO66DRAFT_53161 [Aspergillus aculeatinus CBS 121060]